MGTTDIRLLFLDIDGVLNSQEWYDSQECPGNIRGQEGDLDPKAIRILNKVSSLESTRIVISSDWRINFEVTCQRLYAAGLQGLIIGKTEVTWKSLYTDLITRGEEIENFLKKERFSGIPYVILDDREDFTEEQKKNHLVQTDYLYGIQESDILKIKDKWKISI